MWKDILVALERVRGTSASDTEESIRAELSGSNASRVSWGASRLTLDDEELQRDEAGIFTTLVHDVQRIAF
jgi:hypothetical protein